MPVAGTKPRVLLGSLHLTAYARSLASQASANILDVTTIADTAVRRIPGKRTGTFNADGPLDVDATANGQADVLADMIGAASSVLTVAHYGLTAGSVVWLGDVIQASLQTSGADSGTVDWSMAAEVNGVFDLNGVALIDLAAVTTDTNGSNVDGAASSANGGVAHLHVTAFSGLDSNDITIEHSANGSTGWATLVTFTQVTGLTSERVVVAAGTTVNRYLRVVDNVTGTGSCTRHVSFARR